MAVCVKSGQALPERNSHFSGHECRHKERFLCPHYSHTFIDGTNCRQLRKPIDVAAILGIKKHENEKV